MIKIIAAVGKNLELGKKGGLIWNIPKDLSFFKEQTMGSTVVMGKNTFNSLPKLLKGRKHYILTDDYSLNKDFSEATLFFDFNFLLQEIKKLSKKEDVYIIGGASIYKQFIDYADEIVLTEILEEDETADVYFPSFDKTKYDKEILGYVEDINNICYYHVVYRKNS